MDAEKRAKYYLRKLSATIDAIDDTEIDHCMEVIRRGWLQGRQIITLGNGGSAITALHFITDWCKMISGHNNHPFRGRSLCDNLGILTAYANDVSYLDVFSEQLKHTAEAGDVVIAISGSGNSENILRAISLANEMGCETIGLCGFNGGQLRRLAKHVFWVEVDDMQLSEDLHAIFGHIVVQRLCGGITSVLPRRHANLRSAATAVATTDRCSGL